MTVSVQSIQSIQPIRPIVATESRTIEVTAWVAASVTCWASNVTFEMSEPDETLSYAGAGMRIRRSNISRRRSRTTPAATDSSAKTERNDESPRMKKSPRKAAAYRGTSSSICCSKLPTTFSRIAGIAGSVNPSTTIATTPSANVRRYGRT